MIFRRSFGSVLDIIPLADTVTKLTARCEVCGKKAFFTFRKTAATQTELIGGADLYMPVCRQHYVKGQTVVETSRIVLESTKTNFSKRRRSFSSELKESTIQ
ncbi:hypothetical protein GOBAR_DD28547 [Gossypium barbadense]|nr:hypothetical protein GOBAR_DD28547 [Gossypium barbadense]